MLVDRGPGSARDVVAFLAAMKRRWLLAALVTLAVRGPVAAADLTVFAAASLADALREIGPAYQTASGNKVVFNFGPSNDLARQIRGGAAADLFFSADPVQIDGIGQLAAPGTRRDVLANALVIIVPANALSNIKAPRDLAGLDNVAIANPDAVPAGVYARKYLEHEALWEEIQPHVVPTVDVRAALAAVASEHADAGIVYKTDAATSPKVRVVFEVPRADLPPIVYPLVTLAAAKKEASSLAAYLTSSAAASVYTRYGFIVLPAK
jgi:molybdate transport system substrate-binding protein